MSKTIREELKVKYLAEGGLQENLTNESQTIAGMIHAMNNPAKAIPKIGVASEDADKDMFGDGVKVSDMQSGVVVEGNKIKGKLFKLTEGSLVNTYGEGYFVALKFTGADDESVTSCKVGLNPSMGTGLVELKGDPDQDGGFKVTNKTQVFEIHQIVGGVEAVQQFDLTELVFA